MPYQVAVTAWGHLIGCEKVTDETFDALRAFRDRYRDQGPEQAPSIRVRSQRERNPPAPACS